MDNNLSGLTFDPDLNLLWAVTNGPNELLALSREGDVERRYSLDGFHDVEAVSYASNGQLVIAEERRQSLVIVDVPIAEDGKLSPDRPLSRDKYSALTLALGKEDNSSERAEQLLRQGLPAEAFEWFRVSKAVSQREDGPYVIQPLPNDQAPPGA